MARALWARHFTFQDKSQIYKEIRPPPKIYMPLAIESDVVITQKYLPSLSFLKGLLLLGELSYLQNHYRETYCIFCSRWPLKASCCGHGLLNPANVGFSKSKGEVRISTMEGECPVLSHGLQCVTKTWWRLFPQIIALFQSLLLFYKYILVPRINLSDSQE